MQNVEYPGRTITGKFCKSERLSTAFSGLDFLMGVSVFFFVLQIRNTNPLYYTNAHTQAPIGILALK